MSEKRHFLTNDIGKTAFLCTENENWTFCLTLHTNQFQMDQKSESYTRNSKTFRRKNVEYN